MITITDKMDASTSTIVAKKPTSNRNGRIAWPKAFSMKQNFSFPSSIIYYMAKNPSSPEVYLKLAMSCKYFFEKEPLLIVQRINGNRFCSSKDWQECYDKKDNDCCVFVNLAKITCKIWITNRYDFDDIPSFDALLPDKLYKKENVLFTTVGDEIVFKNFKSVASCFEKFDLICVKMPDKDGNIVQFDEILGSLPNVKELEFFGRPPATASTMKKILQLDNLRNLHKFKLCGLSEIFDAKDLENLIMKHNNTKFWFEFRHGISACYQSQLNVLCDTVIAAEACKCIIEYRGQDEKKLAIMRERYNN